MAGKAKSKRGFGKKLKDQQVTNKELYNISGAVPTQASNSIVASGSQGGGTYQNAQGADIFMNTYDIVDVDRLKFATKEGAGDSLGATDTGIDSLFSGSTSYGMKIQIPMDTANVFQIMRGTTEVFNANEISTIIGGGEGELIALNDNVQMGADYLQMGGMVSPTNPPVNSRRIFVDTDNSDHLTVRKSDGTEVDLEAGSTGANTSLSNLTDPTAINQHLIPTNSSKDLGSSSEGWRYLYCDTSAYLGAVSMSGSIDCNDEPILDAQKIEFCNGVDDVTPAVTGISSTAGGVMELNVATGNIFDFKFNDVSTCSISATTITHSNLILSNSLIINNSSVDPNANGMFTTNGTDVKVYTGGGVKSLSDIGTGSGGADTDLSNLTGTGESHFDSTYATLSGGNSISGTQTFTGDVEFDEDVTLGSSATDQIYVNGDVDFLTNTASATINFYSLFSQGYITIKIGGVNKRLYYFAG